MKATLNGISEVIMAVIKNNYHHGKTQQHYTLYVFFSSLEYKYAQFQE